MYESLLKLEVSVRYGIGSSFLLSDEKHDRKSEMNICLPEMCSISNKKSEFLPQMSEF